jgi:plastocyanin
MKSLIIVVLIIGMLSLAFGCGGGAVEPDEEGTVNITLDDFKFTPDTIELKSGRKVRMILNNKSKVHDHGFMIGLDVVRQGGAASGYKSHFFEGVDVNVIGPAKMVIAGGASVTWEGQAVEDSDGGDADGAQGFMVLIGPSSESTVIEFTVPEKYGEWEFASFENDGERYEDGMRGTVKVFPCLASTNSRQSRC